MPISTDTKIQAGLIGAQLVGGALAGSGSGKQSDKDREAARQRLLMQQQADLFSNQQSNQLERDQQSLAATQLNPLAQQQARADMALKGDHVKQWSPTDANYDDASGIGNFTGGNYNFRPSDFTKGFYSPEAMANAEQQDFRAPLANMNPNVPGTNPADVGYGPEAGQSSYQKVEGLRNEAGARQGGAYDAERERLENAWAIQKAAEDPEKKGTSFWKKLAKVGLVAGGAAAIAFTGGAATPLVLGGIGAANAKLDGAGWKGTLLGAGIGAATAGIPGVGNAASSATGSVGSKLASSIVNPQTIAKMAGAGIGGNTGAAVGMAGNFMPSSFHGTPSYNTGPAFNPQNPQLAQPGLSARNFTSQGFLSPNTSSYRT